MAKTTDIPLSTFAAATAPVDAGSQRIVNLDTPTGDTDAANKQYVDTAVSAVRGVTTKSAAETLTDAEVLGGLVLITNAVAVTLPAASAGNEGADLFVSASAAASLVCSAGFHGLGAGADTLAFVAGQGCHVYSDGVDWYLVGSGPDCALS